MKKIGIIILAAVSVIALFILFLKVTRIPQSAALKTPSASEVDSTPTPGDLTNTSKSRYILPRNHYDLAGYQGVELEQGDFRIINTITKKVIIQSTSETCGTSSDVLALPNPNQLILFRSIPGLDGIGVQQIFTYNLTVKSCKEMDVSKYFPNSAAFIVSPNQQVGVLISEDQPRDLRLVDLVNDSTKILTTLPQGETLNGGYGALSNFCQVYWIDNHTVEYVAYREQLPSEPEKDSGKDMIGIRKIQF